MKEGGRPIDTLCGVTYVSNSLRLTICIVEEAAVFSADSLLTGALATLPYR